MSLIPVLTRSDPAKLSKSDGLGLSTPGQTDLFSSEAHVIQWAYSQESVSIARNIPSNTFLGISAIK